MARLTLAFRCFFRILSDREFGEKVHALDRPVADAAAPESARDAIRLLRLFQRDGRLVDFLREDITPYSDAQVGAAARSLHKGCRKVLDDCFEIQPVREEREEAIVTVREGYDPSDIQLLGAVPGKPPYRGTLKHHGWKVARTTLPPVPEGQDDTVLAPAEIEIP